MKLTKLSELLLMDMVKEYSKSHNKDYELEYFKELYPDESDDFLSDALYLLESDGFVIVQPADDVAYTTILLPEGIRNAEENTMLKKGYEIFKEIRSLI